MRTALGTLILVVAVGFSHATADETLYRYEGDILPYDESLAEPDRWLIFNPCEDPCSKSLEDGHFVLHWTRNNDRVDYTLKLSRPEPPVPPFWVEWRFRSNHPIGPSFFTCDGQFRVRFGGMNDSVRMYGDTAISDSGDDFIGGLAIEEFHTHRCESPDGINYTFAVDGLVFHVGTDDTPSGTPSIKMIGAGGCDSFQNTVNEWDFVRFGKITAGEQVVSSDPPAGSLDSAQFSSIDRFAVTFDSANYVYIDDITVEVTGGIRPTVIQTRRRENTEPDTVEIVLDRPMSIGQTTTFTFDTGIPADCDADPPVNCIKYTLVPAVCGDGQVTFPVEECDDGAGNSDTIPDACRTDCSLPTCGDNVTDGGEQCDGTSDNTCPGDCQQDCTCNIPEIPTLSHWGLLAMAVLLLALSRRHFARFAT